MKYTLKEVLEISEYVRASSKSTPKIKTIDIIKEYLNLKNAKTNRH